MMFPFPRRAPGCPGPHEAPPRAGGGMAVQPGVRDTPERRAGHAPGAQHLPGADLPAGALLGLTSGCGGEAIDAITGGTAARACEEPAGSGGVIP